MELLFQERGYEIHRSEDSILLLDRKTWIVGYITGVLGVTAFLLLALGLLVMFGATQTMPEVSGSVMLVVSIGSFVVASMLNRVNKRRLAIPVAEVVRRLTLDSRAGVLQDGDGNGLASLDLVRATEQFDWSTRGMMRVVVLRWPGGRRTVFRTIRRQRAREIAQMLNEPGNSEF
ncbi:hypothetical protein KAJ02_09355 [Candidatus Bipolaricaulota bacterium]|nr:hypothetical protein [Candidatus Bipolaricaulota bacterium]